MRHGNDGHGARFADDGGGKSRPVRTLSQAEKEIKKQKKANKKGVAKGGESGNAFGVS